MPEKSLAGICQTSPASVKLDINAYRKRTRASWSAQMASDGFPLTKGRLESRRPRFLLLLGLHVLHRHMSLLEEYPRQLRVLVADGWDALNEAGMPVLDADSPMQEGAVSRWATSRKDCVKTDLGSIGNLEAICGSAKDYILFRLQNTEKAISSLMLEITQIVASQTGRSEARREFLYWLASSPAESVDDLAARLSPHVARKDLETHLGFVESRGFASMRTQCRRLVKFLRNGCSEQRTEEWIRRNVKSEGMSAYDVRYLASVFRQ